MFVPFRDRLQSPSTQKLLHIWAQRYRPDLSCPSDLKNRRQHYRQLETALTPEYRLSSAAKLTRKYLKIKCERASLQAQALYSAQPNVVSLSEAQRLASTALNVYLKLVEVYQSTVHCSGILSEPVVILQRLQKGGVVQDSLPLTSWGMPPIQELVEAMNPLLQVFYQQHLDGQAWRPTGFLTTLLNFTNQLILAELPSEQQWLLKPYLRFVEEQVAMPWQQVCIEADRYPLDSPMVAIVAKGLSQTCAIAHQVYQQLCNGLPYHRSRRGTLEHPGIKHSVIRDLQMNQVYFWLSFLQQSSALLEKSLVPLFIIVNSAIGVNWRFVLLANQLLMDRMLAGVSLEHIALVYPHANRYLRAFALRQAEFKGKNLEQMKAHIPSFSPFNLEDQTSLLETINPENLRQLQLKLSNSDIDFSSIDSSIRQYILEAPSGQE